MSEVVVGSFTAQSGKEHEALEACRALVAPTHAEDGCILYALNQGAEDPRRFAFIERWTSKKALDPHLTSPHVKAFIDRLDELFDGGPDIVVYDAVPDGETHKGSLAAHAGSEA